MISKFFFIVISSSSMCFSLTHFEHYKNLHLQTHLSEMKILTEEFRDSIPIDYYESIMFHIYISQKIVNEFTLSSSKEPSPEFPKIN